nr:RHS repeat-associated core domain-containing protein [Algoriphagus sp. AGSA1]
MKANKYLYQGKEMMDDQNLNIYDFHARGYDPVIGRTLQQDPHAENYLSLSPYSWAGNNPMLYVDPDGMDINFYTWVQNGEEWERKEVSFDQLDKNIQKALESFAKTNEGNAFLGQFAKAGDKIGSVEFKADGEFSKHEMGFDQFSASGYAYGTSGDTYDGKRIGFYMKLNTARSNEDQNPESYAITAGHEAFIHLDQYTENLIKAVQNNDAKAYRAIKGERRKIANDRNGGPEHDGYMENKQEYARMRGFVNQLKNLLNPSEVNKQIQKHDNRLK